MDVLQTGSGASAESERRGIGGAVTGVVPKIGGVGCAGGLRWVVIATDTVTGTRVMVTVAVCGAIGTAIESETDPGGTAVSMVRSCVKGGVVTGDVGLRPARSAL